MANTIKEKSYWMELGKASQRRWPLGGSWLGFQQVDMDVGRRFSKQRNRTSKGPVEDAVSRRGVVYMAWCMCGEEMKDKAEMTGWSHIMDLLSNFNETRLCCLIKESNRVTKGLYYISVSKERERSSKARFHLTKKSDRNIC